MSHSPSAEPFAFDVASDTTFLGKSGKGAFIFKGVASDKWSIGEVPNGGYVMAILIDSVIRHFAEKYQTDPIAMNCFFFSKTIPGHLIVEIDELKMSRKGYCVVRAALKQRKDLKPLENLKNYDPSEWQDKVQGIFTMGNMDNEQGPTYFYKQPQPPSNTRLEPYNYVFMGEFLTSKLNMDSLPNSDTEPGKPELEQEMQFSDGRPIDFKSIPYWCDMFIALPTMLGPSILGGPVWCPTMQLEVLFKRKPSGRLIKGHYLSSYIINGRFDLSGEIWDENDEILAVTRHQCLIVPWNRNSKDKNKGDERMNAILRKSKM